MLCFRNSTPRVSYLVAQVYQAANISVVITKSGVYYTFRPPSPSYGDY